MQEKRVHVFLNAHALRPVLREVRAQRVSADVTRGMAEKKKREIETWARRSGCLAGAF